MEMASLLNKYFVSVFNKMDTSGSKLDNTVGEEAELCLTNIENKESDIKRSISEFKEHKSPGVDGITSTYVLKTKEIMVEPLRLLYKRSIYKNEVPEDWKKANVSPIFKKGDRSSVENYRPVSLTSMYGKIIKEKIEMFLMKNNLIK